MKFIATKQRVANRGTPPDSFLAELVQVVRALPDDIFEERPNPTRPQHQDIYTVIQPNLAPGGWTDIDHRIAGGMEALRVLGGYESSWNWNEGKDSTNPSETNAETMSAGLWQVSYNSRGFGSDLRDMIDAVGIENGVDFQKVMKGNHPFAIEYTMRLLRYTDEHHGPVKRREIVPFLKQDAVAEFRSFLT